MFPVDALLRSESNHRDPRTDAADVRYPVLARGVIIASPSRGTRGSLLTRPRRCRSWTRRSPGCSRRCGRRRRSNEEPSHQHRHQVRVICTFPRLAHPRRTLAKRQHRNHDHHHLLFDFLALDLLPRFFLPLPPSSPPKSLNPFHARYSYMDIRQMLTSMSRYTARAFQYLPIVLSSSFVADNSRK